METNGRSGSSVGVVVSSGAGYGVSQTTVEAVHGDDGVNARRTEKEGVDEQLVSRCEEAIPFFISTFTNIVAKLEGVGSKREFCSCQFC